MSRCTPEDEIEADERFGWLVYVASGVAPAEAGHRSPKRTKSGWRSSLVQSALDATVFGAALGL